ncbi:MAG: HmuY family protein [Rikenellaceae bacterium]
MDNIKILALLCVAVLAFSCQADDGAGDTTPELSDQASLTLDLFEDQWIYMSLADGKVVGTSDFNDESEDSQWAQRTDWDIAFCNGYIRVNSGTSGDGGAGILVSEQEFEQMTTAPTSGYNEDFVQH